MSWADPMPDDFWPEISIRARYEVDGNVYHLNAIIGPEALTAKPDLFRYYLEDVRNAIWVAAQQKRLQSSKK